MTWAVRTLDQNDLGLDSALKQLKAYIEAAGDANSQQALKRVELQVACRDSARRRWRCPAFPARTVSGSAAFASDAAVPPTRPTRFSVIRKTCFARRWCSR